MTSRNLTRLAMGLLVLIGLVFFKPLAYFAAVMMIFAGLTGICLLDRFFSSISGGEGADPSRSTEEAAKKDLNAMSAKEIKGAVEGKYSEVALRPDGRFSFPVGRTFAESVGYPPDLLERLPPSLWESFTGAGNPQPYVEAGPGETLLDLGCGSGLDLYLYAKTVGPEGEVFGLDFSEAMLRKALKNMEDTGISNVKFLHAPADEIPLSDGFLDIVTANGIYNLSPDKDAVMREVFRVLRPGGRTVFAEIVLKSALPQEIRKNVDDWFRCIGGALPEPDFLARLRATGFQTAEILWKGRNARTGHELALCAVIRAIKPFSPTGAGRSGAPGGGSP